MIPSRQQPEVVEILKKFKQAETVTKDFSKTYKASINEALPDAKQIIDRFHILKNLTEDMLEYLKRTVKEKIKITDLSPVPISEKEVLNRRERRKIETGLMKWETVRKAQMLKRIRKNNTEIAKILQLSCPTVIKYLKMTQPPVDSRPCKLDPYIPEIKKLVLKGYCHTEIFEQIKCEGYTGGISLYSSKMKGIRWEVKQRVRYLKRSDIKRLLYVPLETIQDEQKRKDIGNHLKRQMYGRCKFDLLRLKILC